MRSRLILVATLGERAIAGLRDALERFGTTDLSGTQNRILVHVRPRGARANELARTHEVSRQAISATLHELESLGYVTRRDDDDDGRGVVFVPTARGRAHLDAYVAGIEDIEGGYRSILGGDDFDRFVETARELRHRIRLDTNRSTLHAQHSSGGEQPGT